MSEMMRHLFSTDALMPHGRCLLWRPGLLGLHVVSDLSIGLACVAISLMLALLARRLRDLPFQRLCVAFGVFIIACGLTHFMEVWTVWSPRYFLSGGLKLVTALAAVGTALMLPVILQKVIEHQHAAGLARARSEELAEAHQALGALYERARTLDQEKSSFFANVSHELRTPLSLILGPVGELLRDESLSADQRRSLSVVERNARTLLKHVSDLLDMSKLEAGKMQAHYARVDAAQLARLLCAHFELHAAERGITLSIEAEGPLIMDLDPAKVERVLLNLLSNAFKFTPDGGRIRCAVRAGAPGRPGYVLFEVADSGPGVPPEMAEAIFERFRQGEPGAKRRFGGTGLGLSIAREFVELHRGSLSVGHAPEGGALFTVALPQRAPEGAEVLTAPEESGPTSRLSRESSSGELALQMVAELHAGRGSAAPAGGTQLPVVLVVEDNPEMARFIADSLSGEACALTAGDGREGLDKALEACPDVIITDVMMPGMSGDELVRALRAREETADTPVVVLTARADDGLRVALLRAGAQDYLMKPFSAEELRARVGNLLRMKRARDLMRGELRSREGDLVGLTAQLVDGKRQLRQALDSMRVAREQAEQASRAKGQLLRLVSHELRTPLTTLCLQMERLRRDRDATFSERQHGMLRSMSSATDRLREMIDALLQQARSERGALEVSLEVFDPCALAREVVEELRPQAEEKGLAVASEGRGEGLPPMRSDPRLLRLILINLVTNAIKFTERGHVRVVISHEGGAHRFAVEDSGPGIPAADMTRIFEPFQHLEPVKHKHTPGIGLGLSLVRAMVDALGGRIEVTSQVAEGSVFTVELPSLDEGSAAA